MNDDTMDPCHRARQHSAARRAAPCGSAAREIAIFNLGDRFLAVDNRCPHQRRPALRRHRRRRHGGLPAARLEGQPAQRRGRAARPARGRLRADLSDPGRGRLRDHRPAAAQACKERQHDARAQGFLRAGHLPTLVAALLYFDVSFMAWMLLGPLAPFLRDDLGLTATQQGLLTADPAAWRIALPAAARHPWRSHSAAAAPG